MLVVGIDPGKHHFAWASMRDGELIRAGFEQGSLRERARRRFDKIKGDLAVIEIPQVYQWGDCDPADLVAVTITSGVVGCALFGFQVEYVIPHVWKGGVKKRIHHPRIRSLLDDGGRAIIDGLILTKKQMTDVMDAVGLAQFAHERLANTKGVR